MKTISSLVAVAFLASCTTNMLWEAADPHEYIAISRDEITEAELQEKGLDYVVSEKWNVYYVEKSVLQKTRDYAYRSFGTPVTVVIDATTAIVVVGGITFAVIKAGGIGSTPQGSAIHGEGLGQYPP